MKTFSVLCDTDFLFKWPMKSDLTAEIARLEVNLVNTHDTPVLMQIDCIIAKPAILHRCMSLSQLVCVTQIKPRFVQ